jgi:hypothetical protein
VCDTHSQIENSEQVQKETVHIYSFSLSLRFTTVADDENVKSIPFSVVSHCFLFSKFIPLHNKCNSMVVANTASYNAVFERNVIW